MVYEMMSRGEIVVSFFDTAEWDLKDMYTNARPFQLKNFTFIDSLCAVPEVHTNIIQMLVDKASGYIVKKLLINRWPA